MDLDVDERREIVSTTIERLSLVIGASGNAEELVSLVTQIVKALKKLIAGAPDATKTRGTSSLAEFVFAAKKIAKDARAVDSASLQQLSRTKKAVESLVKEVNLFYESQQSYSSDVELESLLRQTSLPSRPAEPVNDVGRVSPTDAPPTTETERRLAAELRRHQESLQAKTEPQRNPVQHGQPSDVLRTAMVGLQRATGALVDASGHKAPAKGSVLEPTLLLTKMVSMLMDLVDSLFVSKYPMRTQVHSFCCMLIDNALVYGEQSKTDDAASLRLISTQAPALMSAIEVMAEQCYKRSENIRESQKMSIQRGVDLHDLDLNGPGHTKSPVVRKRKDPPLPPAKKEQLPPPPPKEFEIGCMICTNVAVDRESKEILTKGSEIKLCVNENNRVGDVRKMLTKRTGLPLEHIQLRFRGDDVLLDEVKVTPDNAIPYFMFNKFEPGEEELQDFKKKHRRERRIRIDNADWSKVPNLVAVALYDYESLGDGEDDSLEFVEGELIEIVEKSGDGWWTARIDGHVGVIPASFVEEIAVPQSKDEAKKLVKRFKQGRLGAENHTEAKAETMLFDDDPRSHTSSPSPSTAAPSHNPLSGVSKALRRIHSGGSHDYSKLGNKKNIEPLVKEKKDKKRGSLFKKRTNYDPIMEYKEVRRSSDTQVSPLLSSPNNRKHVGSILEYNQEPQTSPRIAVKRLSRPASSPRLVRTTEKTQLSEKHSDSSTSPLLSQANETPQVGNNSLKVKRRPPPPPPPYQKTYPRRAVEDIDPDSITVHVAAPENDPELEPLPVKSSSSMEDLLRNLEEFDELASPSPLNEWNLDVERGKRDFATIPRNELPPKFDSSDSSPDLLNTQTNDSLAPQKPPRKRSKKKPEPSSSLPPPPPESPPETTTENRLQTNIVGGEGRDSPVPQPPPRRKSRKGTTERKNEDNKGQASPVPPPKPLSLSREKESPLLSSRKSPIVPHKPGKSSPIPPPKLKGFSKPIPGWRVNLEKPVCSSAPVSRTVSPEDQSCLSASSRETSVSTDLLTSSPVVMRRTNAVNARLDPDFSDDELEDCTGIGKEGVLHKEGARKVEWKSRYFKLTENTIDYFDRAMEADSSPALGQILVSRMQGAVPLGKKDGFLCFAINMKYDTSVVLGCHSRTDMDDWVKSINKMVKGAKCGEMIQTFSSAYNIAVKCVEYLSSHVIEERALTVATVPSSRVNRWLESIDKGQEPDISKMPDATTAACLLRSLFRKGRLGCLVKYSLAKEVAELTQSANPISILSTKLNKLSLEARDLLKQLLRLFSKVLEYSHKNSTELDDLNRTFGTLVFERMGPAETEPLLAYFISTCELIIS